VATSKQPWFLGAKGGPSGQFHSIVNGQGRVIATMVANSDDAALLAAAPVLRDANAGLVRALRALEGDAPAIWENVITPALADLIHEAEVAGQLAAATA
jgi:hypothetical protein